MQKLFQNYLTAIKYFLGSSERSTKSSTTSRSLPEVDLPNELLPLAHPSSVNIPQVVQSPVSGNDDDTIQARRHFNRIYCKPDIPICLFGTSSKKFVKSFVFVSMPIFFQSFQKKFFSSPASVRDDICDCAHELTPCDRIL